MEKRIEIETFRITITGLVQGVGFRPFVLKLAKKQNLTGWVENRNDGVIIEVNGSQSVINHFKENILNEAPMASEIQDIDLEKISFQEYIDFSIKKSKSVSDAVTEIGPDIAVCPDCLSDMEKQAHRINYPFINCTNCGPRFSIIEALPYDRPNTTMKVFDMCEVCRKEYENILDRRFHAQPIACSNCGPELTLYENGINIKSTEKILNHLSRNLSLGKVYLLKGMGGFHLMCDAFNEEGIAKLRSIKQRDGKPFALMFSSLEEARSYVLINDEEQKLLESWQRPIVLLEQHKDVSDGIASGLDKLGIMLPYMPFHHMLFKKIQSPAIVLTSGNFSDEPVLISNKLAKEQFESRVDGIISYNREIINRNDDSVLAVFNNRIQMLRRSRGYAPSPIRTHLNMEGVFAAGAELVNSFCIGKGKNAIMSQYIGDLKNFESMAFYEEIFERYTQMFRFKPELIVHDLHPDYLSTKFAIELSERLGGIPLLPVQHHFAHITSVMLAKGIEERVIGFSMDGLGLGSDGKIWGAEIMLVGYEGFERLFHFEYMPLPGGDIANKEPWRMALSYLLHAFNGNFDSLNLTLLDAIDKDKISKIQKLIANSFNSPLISSAGRLFDAVSAILGLNYISTYQAEAPMLLESIADMTVEDFYDYKVSGDEIIFADMIKGIVDDHVSGISNSIISGKFHNTLVKLMLDLAIQIRTTHQINHVVLSGGTFQNRKLSEKLIRKLEAESFSVALPGIIPVNDQGIALGQMAIGAAKRIKK